MNWIDIKEQLRVAIELPAWSTNWIDIKEQQPENRQQVLITDGHIVTAARADTKSLKDRILWDGCEFSGYEWDWDFDARAVTHWAELPKPPVCG